MRIRANNQEEEIYASFWPLKNKYLESPEYTITAFPDGCLRTAEYDKLEFRRPPDHCIELVNLDSEALIAAFKKFRNNKLSKRWVLLGSFLSLAPGMLINPQNALSTSCNYTGLLIYLFQQSHLFNTPVWLSRRKFSAWVANILCVTLWAFLQGSNSTNIIISFFLGILLTVNYSFLWFGFLSENTILFYTTMDASMLPSILLPALNISMKTIKIGLAYNGWVGGFIGHAIGFALSAFFMVIMLPIVYLLSSVINSIFSKNLFFVTPSNLFNQLKIFSSEKQTKPLPPLSQVISRRTNIVLTAVAMLSIILFVFVQDTTPTKINNLSEYLQKLSITDFFKSYKNITDNSETSTYSQAPIFSNP